MGFKIKLFKELSDPFFTRAAGHAEIAAHVPQNFSGGHKIIHIVFLRRQADFFSRLSIFFHYIQVKNFDRAFVKFSNAGDAINGRGFACAVRA